MEQVIGSVMEYVKIKQRDESSGHDWWHTYRVYMNAIDIAQHMKDEAVEMHIVQLGALLHDVADHKFGYSDTDRSEIITTLLKEYGVEEDDITKVIQIANTISFKNKDNQMTLSMIEAKIVQDADRLDALGAIGIARTFTYGGFMNRVMYNPELLRGSEMEVKDTIQHFYDKLLLLKDRMNTEYGKKLAEERHAFIELYLQQFYREWGCENKEEVL